MRATDDEQAVKLFRMNRFAIYRHDERVGVQLKTIKY